MKVVQDLVTPLKAAIGVSSQLAVEFRVWFEFVHALTRELPRWNCLVDFHSWFPEAAYSFGHVKNSVAGISELYNRWTLFEALVFFATLASALLLTHKRTRKPSFGNAALVTTSGIVFLASTGGDYLVWQTCVTGAADEKKQNLLHFVVLASAIVLYSTILSATRETSARFVSSQTDQINERVATRRLFEIDSIYGSTRRIGPGADRSARAADQERRKAKGDHAEHEEASLSSRSFFCHELSQTPTDSP